MGSRGSIVILVMVAVSLSAWTQSGDQSSWNEFGKAMHAMHSSMSSIKSSGDPDTDFARLMLPHHQAAIDMAKTELVEGRDPQIRRLAQEIIADQQSEIELMQLWLKRHGTGKREIH